MIKEAVSEFVEDNLVVRTIRITFLGLPIFTYRKTSTNKMALQQYTPVSVKNKQIKGFSK